MRSEVAQHMTLDHIRYSQVWEDHALLEDALEITPEDDVLSITSAGDNALALMLQNPNSVTCVDMNPTQTALTALKIAAIRHIPDHADFLGFLGFAPDDHRVARYRDVLRHEVDEATRTYWDAHTELIRDGVAHQGRLERYMAQWRQEHRPKVWPDALVETLFTPQPLDAQRALYMQRARTPDFVASLLQVFGREMLAKGRDEAQFAHVDQSQTGRVFLERFDRVCTTQSMAHNPYLWRLIRGELGPLDHVTPYLNPANYDRLRGGLLDRLTLHTVELEQVLQDAPRGAYSALNLSDVFEYMSAELTHDLYETFAERLRPGARIAFWNLLVERHRPDDLSDRITAHTDRAQALLERDRAWFYGAFHIEEIQ